ncbi:hypothetical protein ACQP2T_23450 [Nonomuraea sp. CA-143628]|uniref:hypothetical protein n=1 Tax=Nonomuraea sp. CA-143628 TaxID=3239997 RepID=UPI003D8E39EA
MPPGQTAGEGARPIEDVHLPTVEDTAPDLLGAAAAVLRDREIPHYALQIIRLRLGFGYPGIPESLTLLEICGAEGVVATVSASKDGCLYYVSVPSAQAEPYQVPAEQPEGIPALMPGHNAQDGRS